MGNETAHMCDTLLCLICPKIPSDQWHFIYPQTLIAVGVIGPFSINAQHARYKLVLQNLFYTRLVLQ